MRAPIPVASTRPMATRGPRPHPVAATEARAPTAGRVHGAHTWLAPCRASTRFAGSESSGSAAAARGPTPAMTRGARPDLGVGIDVGGTKIVAGLVDRAGRVLRRCRTTSHAERPPLEVIAAIERLYAELAATAGEVAAVGVGFAGNLDAARGEVLVSSNLPAWDHFPLRATLEQRLGGPVALDNDVNMAVVAEHRYGAGRGCRNLCFLTVSTGLGIGIIVDGKVYAGRGSAGELGHVVIELNGAPCTCGKRGCIMAYASGIGISRMAYEAIDRGDAPVLAALLPPGRQRIAAETVADAAARGDAAAREILQRAGRYAGLALAAVVQILDPELLVIGGGLTRLGAVLLDPALATMRELVQEQMVDSVRVEISRLGEEIGVLGAAARAFTDLNHARSSR
jgi:glucokinase